MLTGLSARPQRELTKNKIKPCAASADCLPNKAKTRTHTHTHRSTGNVDKIRNSLKESKQEAQFRSFIVVATVVFFVV